MEDQGLTETVSILDEIPGGRAAVAWFHGRPEFHDAEVLELRLVRKGPSRLRLSASVREGEAHKGPLIKHGIFDFTLRDMIDVHLDGFGHQNVIFGLRLRRAEPAAMHPSLLGMGLAPGAIEIELHPCAGAFGTIRCSIEKIVITPVADYQMAD
jgi:hypothetical protein